MDSLTDYVRSLDGLLEDASGGHRQPHHAVEGHLRRCKELLRELKEWGIDPTLGGLRK